MGPIKYGIFIMPFHDQAKPLGQCYDEDMELVIRADELGFSEFWIGEHHTMVYENIVMPEIFIAAAMRETRNIRMGPAPICLNQHHPGQVASRISFLDHLTKGRLDLCFGPGATSSDLELYGVEPKNSAEMVEESIDMILKLWESDGPVEIDGKYWSIRIKDTLDDDLGLGVIHKPLQQPHPPIAMPSSSRNSSTAKSAGRRGFRPFSHSIVASNVLTDMWQTYKQAALESGRQPDRTDWRVARAIFLADSTKEAQKRARTNSVGRNFEYIGRIMDGGPGRSMLKRDLEMSDADCNIDFFMKEHIIAGDVDEVLRRLLLIVEETGEFGTLIMMSYDWDDKESWINSLELFAKELMPALNKELRAVPV